MIPESMSLETVNPEAPDNRSFLYDEVRAEMERNPGNFALLEADLDGLKAVNDTLGHPEGDKFIENARDLLSSLIRRKDRLGGGDELIIANGLSVHTSGDEYWIILEDVKEQSTVDSFINRIQQELDDLGVPLSLGGKPHQPGESLNDLVKHVDELMYINKLERTPELDDDEVVELYAAVETLESIGVSPRDVEKYLAAIAFRKAKQQS